MILIPFALSLAALVVPALPVLWTALASVTMPFALWLAACAGPGLPALWTCSLLAATAYAIAFTGFRLRRVLAPFLPGPTCALEAAAIELGLGAGVFILCGIALGAAGCFHAAAAWGALASSLLGRHVPLWREWGARLSAVRVSPFEVPALASLGIAALLSGIESLTPVTAQDALVYHLAIPAKYIASGGFTPVPESFFASFPQNIEMLFVFGLLLDGESLAQSFHWLLGAMAVVAVAALARAVRPGASAWLAAAVFGTIPTVLLIGSWAYVDLGVVLFIVLSALAFVRWLGTADGTGGRDGWLWLAAAFAGLATGSKYTAGFQGLLVAGLAFVAVRARGERSVRALWAAAGAAAIVGLIACPWWIKNAVYTGNPLFPFAHGILGGTGWDAERAQVLSLALRGWGGERGLLAALLLPWRLTMEAQFFDEKHFDGKIGAAFLLGAPLVLWSLRASRPARWLAAAAAAHAAFWFVTTQQIRFLLPSLALQAALLGAAVPCLTAWPGRALGGTLLGLALAANVVLAGVHFASRNPLPVVLGLETREAFLARDLPGGDAAVFAYIDKELPEDSRILFGSLGNVGFLCKRAYHADAFFENRTLAAVLAGASTAEAAHRELRARGFTHLLFRHANVFDPSGRRSEIPLPDQLKLMELLNAHGRRLAAAGGTSLYALGG